MKKIVLIIVIVVALVGVGFGAYYLGTSNKKEEPANTTPTNTQNTTNVPPATYETFSETGGYVGFDTVSEWTSIAPEEVQKAIPAEQRHGYEVVYYAANPEGIILSVAKKPLVKGTVTLEQNFEDDLTLAQQQSASYRLINKKVTDEYAEVEATIPINNTPYTIYGRAVMKSVPEGNQDLYYLLQVSVPSNRSQAYGEVIRHLLDSLTLFPATVN